MADYTLFRKTYQFCPSCQKKLTSRANSVSCSACGFITYHNPAPAVVVLISKGPKSPLNNQVLLAKRAIEPVKGTWDTPGGFIDTGESAEEAVHREIAEETGLTVKIKKTLGSVPDIYGNAQTPTFNLIYLVEIIAGQPKAQDDVAELKWFNIDDLPQNLSFENTKITLEIYKKMLK